MYLVICYVRGQRVDSKSFKSYREACEWAATQERTRSVITEIKSLTDTRL